MKFIHTFAMTFSVMVTTCGHARAADPACDVIKSFFDAQQTTFAASRQTLTPQQFAEWATRLRQQALSDPTSPCAPDVRIQASMCFSLSSATNPDYVNAISVVREGIPLTTDVVGLASLGNQAIGMITEANARRLVQGEQINVDEGPALARDVVMRMPAWSVQIERAQAGTLSWGTFDLILPLRAHALEAMVDRPQRLEATRSFINDLTLLAQVSTTAGEPIETTTWQTAARSDALQVIASTNTTTIEQLEAAAIQLGALDARVEIDGMLGVGAMTRAQQQGVNTLSIARSLELVSESLRSWGASDNRAASMHGLLIEQERGAMLAARTAARKEIQGGANNPQDNRLAASDAVAQLRNSEAYARYEREALDAYLAVDAQGREQVDAATLERRRAAIKVLLIQRWNREGNPRALADDFARRYPEDLQHPMVVQSRLPSR